MSIISPIHPFPQCLIILDDTITVYYFSKQGGTRSTALCMKVVKLQNWCITHQILLFAVDLPGTQNMIADPFSRPFVINHKWELYNTIIYDIFDQCGTLIRELFASPANNKCSREWGGYLVPPSKRCAHTPLIIADQLRLPPLCHSCHEFILIATCWPRPFWFPNLLFMSAHPPIPIPSFPKLLTQHHGRIRHPDPQTLHLGAWYLDGNLLYSTVS